MDNNGRLINSKLAGDKTTTGRATAFIRKGNEWLLRVQVGLSGGATCPSKE